MTAFVGADGGDDGFVAPADAGVGAAPFGENGDGHNGGGNGDGDTSSTGLDEAACAAAGSMICDVMPNEVCGQYGATCEVVSVMPGCTLQQLCRWAEATDAAQCALTSLGRWRAAGSAFAGDRPRLVSGGHAGVCARVASSMRCPIGAASRCEAHGASCELVRHLNGEESALCRWSAADGAASAPTPGIWTTVDSLFARNHTHAVAAGADGVCSTRARNLPPE